MLPAFFALPQRLLRLQSCSHAPSAQHLGRMRLRQRGILLASHLWDAFCANDRGQRVAATGLVIPHGTLRSRSLRESLAWAKTLPYKFVTVKVALRAVHHLQRKHHLEFPIIPGVSPTRWHELEARRIARICYRVKKNCLAAAARARKLAMDHEETQPWSVEALTVNMTCDLNCLQFKGFYIRPLLKLKVYPRAR